MTNDKSLRDHLLRLVSGKDAHLEFEDIISDWPVDLRGVRPNGTVHTAWQLLEHLRIAQWDILEFSRSSDHVSPEFPEGYWPKSDAPQEDQAWSKSIVAFEADRRAMQDLIADGSTNLFARIPHGTGQTIFREACVVAKHNSYHLGQLVLLRRLLGAWQ